jgi:hypothetical protein
MATKRKAKLLRVGQAFRVVKKNKWAPLKALGEVISAGVGAKGKIWYGSRFMNWQNPDGFMQATMWEGEIRPLTKREAGQP